MKTLPLELPLVKHPEARMELYPHQALMLDEWDNHDAFLLVTKTGSGKTAAAALPLIKRLESAVFVYPTNELVQDQARSIARLLEREAIPFCFLTSSTRAAEYAKAKVVTIGIDTNVLEEWRKVRKLADKGSALKYLLTTDKPKLIFTNPDILFLIFTLRYRGSAEVLGHLQAYQTLVVDEFHLYTGVELAHAFFMIHLARNLGIFKRVILLSATPAPEVRDYVDALLQPYEIDAGLQCCHPVVGSRRAVESVEVTPMLAGRDIVSSTRDLVLLLRDEIESLYSRDASDRYIPAVIIVNSVVNAIRLEDELVQAGFPREAIVPIRGLTARGIRHVARKMLAIGTSAIEVGVDFDCDYLVFEAGDAASFMQRFGRAGRHRRGKAYILCESRVKEAIQSLSTEVSRAAFEERVYSWYPVAEARAWFIRTFGGVFTVAAQARSLLKRVSGDGETAPEIASRVEKWLEQTLDGYAARLQLTRVLNKVRSRYKAAERLPSNYKWISAYERLMSFRTSLPSETILDWAEKERRRPYEYNVDIKTLLSRGVQLKYNEKIGKLTVKGYGKYHRLSVNLSVADEDCGVYKSTEDYPNLMLMQDNHLSSISHVMTMKPHLFVAVPKECESEIDWRIGVFPCGRYLIAFDGDALLLMEIFNKLQNMG
jgi:CRISPR-associated helicase Cas3